MSEGKQHIPGRSGGEHAGVRGRKPIDWRGISSPGEEKREKLSLISKEEFPPPGCPA